MSGLQFLNKNVSETQIRLKNRLWLYILSYVILFLLIVPSLVVIPMSFSASQYLEFPPKEWSLRWYENYFFSWKVENGFNDWMQATWTSVKVAVLTIIVATPIGTMAAYGLVNSDSRISKILFPIFISPMMVPIILVAIGLFYFFVQLKLVGSVIGLVLGHSLVAMPLVLIIVFAVLTAIFVCSILAFFIERIAYRPLRNAPRLAPLITAIGMSILLQNIAMMIWGRQYRTFPELFQIESYTFAGANVTNVQLFIVGISIAIMASLLAVIHLTKVGRAMRATAESPQIASLMGVNVNTVISLTFIIGAGLAAIAGVLVSANYSIAHYSMGFILGLKAFTAAVLGGIGNLTGAMVGGILLGLIERIVNLLFFFKKFM